MLTKWTPFASGGIARSAQLPVFDALFGAPAAWAKDTALPAADIYETDTAMVLKLDLPGFEPSSFHIQVEGDVLTVEARRPSEQLQKANWLRQERTLAHVARSFVLPNTVDGSKCEATCGHGVLTLTLPKREEAKPRSITVKVQS